MKIQREFPDAAVIDKSGEVKQVEFELFASNFIAHNHDADKCDYIVCWENDLDEIEDNKVKMLSKKAIALRNRLGELEE